ncbi:MAG TPA: peptide chain release factor N(5)-glutamine methyltransferase [Vicinamibacteria bacterium]|nr:peptide chain release factor N(5)-glutamine methyltransferase [Vicinamibacteria bacterium]
MTAAALLAEAAARLREAGIEAAGWDAERLLRHVLGCDRASLLAARQAEVAREAEARFRRLVDGRARRVPLQHLVGTQAFWRHEFVVTPEVLVPRPETELLVEIALERMPELHRPLVVDVGTGSGCIALSLAEARPDAEVHATDISPAALAVARENASRLGLPDRVRFHQGDLLQPLGPLLGRLDLVVSNPPYVAEEDRPTLAPEVRDHEPALALFAPERGLAVHRRLAAEAAAALRPGGALVVELGSGQQAAVAGFCTAASLEVAEVRADLAGIPRGLVAVKRATLDIA